jgi:DNA-binding IclR family transcriptional regulator
MKMPPPYAVASVDHALRIATMLQLEGALTGAEVAERLGVARSTAHRLLQMLVYRDFARQDDRRAYHAGPVLELAAHSRSRTSQLRAAALPHLHRLVDTLQESVNLSIRTGRMSRFIASVECGQALRVGSREGMVFPAEETTGGLLLLAELPADELAAMYPDGDALRRLRAELTRVRRAGFVVNQGRSEKGVVAVGVPVREGDGPALAGLSVSMPSVRYDRTQLPALVGTLQAAARALESDLGAR